MKYKFLDHLLYSQHGTSVFLYDSNTCFDVPIDTLGSNLYPTLTFTYHSHSDARIGKAQE
jgi:hypothetical protein